MSKIAILSDTHLGYKSGHPVYLDYMERFFRDIFFPEIDRRDIRHVMHLGDLVEHRRGITYTAMQRIREFFIEPMMERGLYVDLIVGNHDVPYRNTNRVNAQTEIMGGLPGVTIYDEPEDIDLYGANAFLVPWVNRENQEAFHKGLEDNSAKLVLGHLEIMGSLMHKGMPCPHGLDPWIFRHKHMVLSGHFHARSWNYPITYIGNPYHLRWGDDGDERGFVVFDPANLSLWYENNPDSILRRVTLDEATVDADHSGLRNRDVRLVVGPDISDTVVSDAMAAIAAAGPVALQVVGDRTTARDTAATAVHEADADVPGVLREYVAETYPDDADAVTDLVMEIHEEAMAS